MSEREETGAVTDEGMGDASTDGSSSAEGAAATSTESGDATAAASSEPKLKLRRFGKDAEYTAAELRAQMDDDYEHEFRGKLGLPLLRDGKPVKLKWPEIVRAVEQSHGAAEAARRHNEDLKQRQAREEWGRKPENRVAFMKEHLGIEDFDSWAIERAAEAFAKREKMVQLAQTDPTAYERMLREEMMANDKQMAQARARLQEQANIERVNQERERVWFGRVGEELHKLGGVPLNSRTREIAAEIRDAWIEAKQDLPWEKLAELVRDQWHDEIFGYVDAQPDDRLLQLLGDKRRERLRAAELAAMKLKKTESRAAPKPATGTAPVKKKGMDSDDYLRKMNGGGRM